MKAFLLAIAIYLMAGWALQAATAQINRDVVHIGERAYLRSHRNISPFNFDHQLDMSVDSGVIAISGWLEVPDAQEQLGIQHFDHWLFPLHNPVWVDPDRAERAISHSADARSGRTVAFWGARTGTGGNWLRIFSSQGEPLAPSTLVGHMQNAPTRLVGISESNVLALIGVQAYSMRWYSIDLQPLGNLTQFVGPMGGYNTISDVEISPESSYAVVSYTNYFSNGQFTRVFYQIVYPDSAFDAPVEVALYDVVSDCVEILLNDELGIAFSSNPPGVIYLQRRLIDGTVVRAAELDGLYYDVTFDDQGACVLLTRVSNTLFHLQLLDAQWVALGPPFDFTENSGAAPYRVIDDIRKRLAIDNDVVAVLWGAYNGPGAGWYLTSLTPFLPGDMNRDGLVNNFDIDAFVFALSNLPAYAATYNIPEDAAVIIGDIDEDGALNNFDIDPFVLLLAGD
ncbi:MAG: hypothetical protein JNG88_01170 [Phycisphaerales bacterium]|nr:hypothetical protein [Phycisphaerales bacterium]